MRPRDRRKTRAAGDGMAALSKVRLSPWLIAMLAAAWLLEDGVPVQMLVSLVCVLLHEGGHAGCAAAMGCAVDAVELTPFGGAARVRGMEQLSAVGRLSIALAGPAVNALLMLACGCGAYLLPQWVPLWAEGLRINAALLGFNLLPAFPMDGGRVVCALLEGKNGIARAQRLTAGAGILLGLLVAGLGITAYFVVGKFNLTLVLCGGYLCMEAKKARREAPLACMTHLLGREKALQKQEVLPVRTLAVRIGTPDARIAAKLRPGAFYRIAYVDEELSVTREVWETEIWRRMIRIPMSEK